MRIIAGTHRGHRIAAPKGLDTRPTSDRVRESAFNLIGPVDGASVLDLFAGSGAMGLEALSRGAEHATFVEADRRAAETIDENLAKLRLTGARIVRDDAVRALAAEVSAGRKYDLVLVDPPYDLYPDLSRCSRAISHTSSPTAASWSSRPVRASSRSSRSSSARLADTGRHA